MVLEIASRIVMTAILSPSSISNVDILEDVGGFGGRSGARFLDGRLDQRQHFAIDLIERPSLEQLSGKRLGAKYLEAITRFAQPRDLAGSAVALRISLEVSEKPLRIEFDCGRAVAVAAMLDDLRHHLAACEEIATVDLARDHAEGGGTARHVLPADCVLVAGMLRVVVVLVGEYDRHLEYHRHVHRLEGRALV